MKIAISELEYLREEIKNCHQIIKDFQMKRQWVGLTDEEVKHEWEVWRASLPRYSGFAQGIETKLKERNNGY
jgi:hypothetical protein